MRLMTRKSSLHIFRAGRHQATDGSWHDFSEANIADAVASYDPALHKAPLVVGHPKLNSPSFGWAKALSIDGIQMFAEPEHVNPEFAELVNKKYYPKISSSFYLPDSPGNPKPGHYYLRHIGFLGGAAPAVKGLQEASFAEGDGAVEFAQPLQNLGWTLKSLFQRLRDRVLAKEGVEQADQAIPQWAIDSLGEMASANASFAEADEERERRTAEFAERQQELNERTAEIEKRERAIRLREEQDRRAEVAEFAEGLVQSGQLLPRQRAPVLELLMAMPTSTVIDFAEADGQQVQKPAGEVLRELLTGLPKQIDFAEKSRDPNAGGVAAASVDFAAPPGGQVDPGRLQIHNKALDYQRQNPTSSYLAAVKAVGG